MKNLNTTAMRKYIFTFVFIIIFGYCELFGQSGFFNETVHYYKNSFEESIWAVKVDSTHFQNGDSTLYFQDGLISLWSSDCVDVSGPSIVGPKLTKWANGNYSFYNRYGDSVLIDMNANEGTTYLCYEDSVYQVDATVESIENVYFNGEPDVVHTFSFIVQNKFKSKKERFNSIKIGLRAGVIKSRAWVSFPEEYEYFSPDYRVAPNAYFNGALPSFEDIWNVSEADFFNFNIGDELHILLETSESPFLCHRTLTKLNVLDKAIEAEQLTITYKREKQIGTDSIYVDSLENGHYFYMYEDVLVDTFQQSYSKEIDANYSMPMLYSGYAANAMFMECGHFAYVSQFYQMNNDSCSYFFFEELSDIRFVLGLGGPYYTTQDLFNSYPSTERKIKYYHLADGSEYGEPLQFVSINNVINSADLNIYPNPATDLVKFDSGTIQPDRVVVFDARGRKVLDKELFNPVSGSAVKVSHLPQGLYVFVLYRDDQIRARQTFIKQ